MLDVALVFSVTRLTFLLVKRRDVILSDKVGVLFRFGHIAWAGFEVIVC